MTTEINRIESPGESANSCDDSIEPGKVDLVLRFLPTTPTRQIDVLLSSIRAPRRGVQYSTRQPLMQPSRPIQPLLTRIPHELRYMIYDTLMSSRHTIKIAPHSERRGALRDLSRTSKKIRKEIQIWLSTQSELIRSPIFGIFNSTMTKFKIYWVDHCLWEGTKGKKCMFGCHGQRAWTGIIDSYGHFVVGVHYRRSYRQVDGRYTSKVNNRKLGTICDRLEWWQWAMDLTGSIDRDRINDAIEDPVASTEFDLDGEPSGLRVGLSSALEYSKRDKDVPADRLRDNPEVCLAATRWRDWMLGRT